MSVSVTPERGVDVRGLRQHRARLSGGRTWTLAGGDLLSLVIAYAITFVLSAHIAPLSPVSAPTWFLVLLVVGAVPTWLGIFTAYHLYDKDSPRIAGASFGDIRDLCHAMLAGPLVFLIVSQGADHLAGWWVYSAVEEFIFVGSALVIIPLVRGSIRSWVFPRVMSARRTVIVGGGREAALIYRKMQAHPEY